MGTSFTTTQQNRLTELGAPSETILRESESEAQRDRSFRELEQEYVRRNKEKIKNLLDEKHSVETHRLERALEAWLMNEEGFTRVTTPTIISSAMLDQMTISESHHLREQVFWLDKKRCLRPMLAPNLYVVMRELERIIRGPVRIFEIGSCFRKESQGAQHMNEFTMLNFVELGGVEDGKQIQRLEALAKGAMEAVGITDYQIEKEESTVYVETLDIVVNDIEIASGSYGPHPLDANWGVFSTWVGLGIGIERLALVKEGYETIKRFGRSIAFIDGAPLNI